MSCVTTCYCKVCAHERSLEGLQFLKSDPNDTVMGFILLYNCMHMYSMHVNDLRMRITHMPLVLSDGNNYKLKRLRES